MVSENEGLYIYKITNLVNSKIYFGVTKCSLKKRWKEHRCNATREYRRSILAKAMAKYGVENFKIELVKECETEQQMYSLEAILIKTFSSNNNQWGYNNSEGGENSSKGAKHSLETRKRLSEMQIGKKRKPCSEATKEKISIANTGKKHNSVNVRKAAEARRGIPLSEAHRKAVSEARKGIGGSAVNKFSKSGVLLATYPTITQAAELNGICQSSLSNVLTGRCRVAGGFRWQYQDKELITFPELPFN